MSKDYVVNTRIPEELFFQINDYIKLNPGLKPSDVLREALYCYLENINEDFLKTNIESYELKIKKMKEQIDLIKIKQNNIKKIPQKEIDFLLESKEVIDKNPYFLEGRINSYIALFKKPYKVSKQDFFKLLGEAEKQCKK